MHYLAFPYIIVHFNALSHIFTHYMLKLQITMKKRLKKNATKCLPWVSVPLKHCPHGCARQMWMRTSNPTQNPPFCEETNTSSGYGTTPQNSSMKIKITKKIFSNLDNLYTYCDLQQIEFCVHNLPHVFLLNPKLFYCNFSTLTPSSDVTHC